MRIRNYRIEPNMDRIAEVISPILLTALIGVLGWVPYHLGLAPEAAVGGPEWFAILSIGVVVLAGIVALWLCLEGLKDLFFYLFDVEELDQ